MLVNIWSMVVLYGNIFTLIVLLQCFLFKFLGLT